MIGPSTFQTAKPSSARRLARPSHECVQRLRPSPTRSGPWANLRNRIALKIRYRGSPLRHLVPQRRLPPTIRGQLLVPEDSTPRARGPTHSWHQGDPRSPLSPATCGPRMAPVGSNSSQAKRRDGTSRQRRRQRRLFHTTHGLRKDPADFCVRQEGCRDSSWHLRALKQLLSDTKWLRLQGQGDSIALQATPQV